MIFITILVFVVVILDIFIVLGVSPLIITTLIISIGVVGIEIGEVRDEILNCEGEL